MMGARDVNGRLNIQKVDRRLVGIVLIRGSGVILFTELNYADSCNLNNVRIT
jgi:hypothetical protein